MRREAAWNISTLVATMEDRSAPSGADLPVLMSASLHSCSSHDIAVWAEPPRQYVSGVEVTVHAVSSSGRTPLFDQDIPGVDGDFIALAAEVDSRVGHSTTDARHPQPRDATVVAVRSSSSVAGYGRAIVFVSPAPPSGGLLTLTAHCASLDLDGLFLSAPSATED